MVQIKTALIILAYLLVVGMGLNWGIPNEHRIFTYHMDEWHQLSSVKSLAKYGTPNRTGAAHGPILFFISSGVWLKTLSLLNIIQPEQVSSATEDLGLQREILWWARLMVVGYGALCIVVMNWILKILKVNQREWWLAIFAFSPGFILYSGYFKYDIALLFFVLLTIGCVIKFWQTKQNEWWVVSWLAAGLAISTKLAGAPIFLWLIIGGLFAKVKNLKHWEQAICVAVLIFCVVGIPDVFFGKADYGEFLSSNILANPNVISDSSISTPWFIWSLVEFWPAVLGRALVILFGWLFFYWLGNFRRTSNDMTRLLGLGLGIFIVSVLGLKIAGIGNRVLVILPWMIIFSATIFEKINLNKKLASIILLVVLISQIFEMSVWQINRYGSDIREQSSGWLVNNVRPGATIGLEEPVIYQMLPDLVLQEWFGQQEGKSHRLFVYVQMDKNLSENSLPAVVVVTNTNWATIFPNSTKANLIKKINSNGYQSVKTFKSPIPFWILSHHAQSLEPRILAVSTDIQIFVRDNTVLKND